MKQQDENPIDMYRLRRQIRIACTDFSDDNNEEYVPRLHVQSSWEPENAPDEIEDTATFTNKCYKVFYQICYVL